MGEGESRNTHKLPIFSMPRQDAREAPGLLTPPLHPGATIPFQWEEAPGKPRPWLARSPYHPPVVTEGVKRSLDLPPGLLSDGPGATAAASNSIIVSSPNTVLEGPYPRHRKRLLETWSFRWIGSGEKTAFGSLRRDSIGSKVPFHDRKKIETPQGDNPGFSCCNCDQEEMNSDPKVKIIRVKRRRRWRSFLSLSPTKSHLWASICEGFKLAVWRAGCSPKNNREQATNS